MVDPLLFSIVIPVYNAASYISEMVESVIKQTYPFWELILVDDGSTDESGAICDSFKSEKIKVIHQQNQGQMVARCVGISNANGDYTLVVDADDKLNHDCLKFVFDSISLGNYDAIIFPYRFCDKNLSPIGGLMKAPPRINAELNRFEVLKWIIETCNHGLVNKVIRTEIIRKGASEAIKDRLCVNGDYALIIPIICNIRSAFYINKCLYDYRIYGGSISHNYQVQHLIDTEIVSLDVMNIIKRYGLSNKLEFSVKKAFLNMMGGMAEEVIARNLLHSHEITLISEHYFFKNSIEIINRSNLSLLKRMVLSVLSDYSPLKYYFVRIFIYIRFLERNFKSFLRSLIQK